MELPVVSGDSSPHPSVVGPLDVFEHIGTDRIERQMLRAVDPLAIEHAEGPFAADVVAAVTHVAHRARQAIGLQVALVVAAAEFAARVGVEDQRRAVLSLQHHPCAAWITISRIRTASRWLSRCPARGNRWLQS